MKTLMKSKGIVLLMAFLTITMSMAGCSAGQNQPTPRNAVEQQKLSAEEMRKNYLTETITLPHPAICHETVSNDILYYIDNTADETTGPALYRFDLNQNETPELPAIPLTLTTEQKVGGVAVSTTGTVNLLVFQDTGADNQITDVFWQKLDADGKVTDSYTLAEIIPAQGDVLNPCFSVDHAGNALISSEDNLFIYSPDGRLLFQLTAGGHIDRIFQDETGTVYAVWFGSGGYEAALIDCQTGELGSAHQFGLMESLIGIGADNTDKNSSPVFTFATTENVLQYQPQQGTAAPYLNWLSMDVMVQSEATVLPLSEDRLLLISKASQEPGTPATLTLVRPGNGQETPDAAQPKEKITLTLGAMAFTNRAIRLAISRFNQSDPDYRIELIEYGEPARDISEEDLTQVKVALATGNGPDILVMPQELAGSPFIGKGLWEDLNPYLDRDESLDRADLQENILKAYETDGKLFRLPLEYVIETMFIKSALIDGQTSWNMAEMIEFADRNWTGKDGIFVYPYKSVVLKHCLRANGGYLIDWSTGVFRRELFLQMLEFSNRFLPDTEEPEDGVDRIIEGRAVLTESIVTFKWYQEYCIWFGEPITPIGYPAENGNGTVVTSFNTIAISSQCTEKEAAWRFISSMLTAEFQENEDAFIWLPIRRSGLEKMIERLSEKTYRTDENGNQVEIPHATAYYRDADRFALTEEETQAVLSIIEGIEATTIEDSQIDNIITEEAGAYFNGDKSAEEVADIVENRIRIYVSESDS